MADSFKTEDKFADSTLNTELEGSHLIVTEDEKFQNLALSSFDGETLRAWANQSNVKEIIKTSPEFGSGVMAVYSTVLGLNKVEANGERNTHDGYLNIDVWRTKGRNGEYIKYEKFSDWKFEDIYGEIENAPGSIYSYDKLEISEFSGKTFIENIIELNQEVLFKYVDEPDRSKWSAKEKLRDEFITDIMTSKNGYIEWSGSLEFRKQTFAPSIVTQENVDSESEGGSEGGLEGGEQATETVERGVITPVISGSFSRQNIPFKMYFFNGYDEQETGRHVTIKNMELVGKKSYYDLGNFQSTDTGKVFPVTDIYDPNSEVAGKLDTQYNNLLGKWESGTPQMIAIMTTPLPGAQGFSVETLEEENVVDLLDKDIGQEIVFGSAIPLHMQNVNPRQWAPHYEKYENDREPDDFEKSHIRVANLSPNGFSRGDLVILNRIEGLWFPIPINSSGTAEETIPTVFPQWEFMYLMTNARHHFRLKDKSKVTPDEYEKGFYLKYYSEDSIEENRNRYDRNQYQNKVEVFNEYYQITSWDMMGDKIGGLRTRKDLSQTNVANGLLFNSSQQFLDFSEEQSLCTDFGGENSTFEHVIGVNGNALSNTNFYEDVEGESYEREERNTYPFFGCVFPDGFSTGAFFDDINEDVSVAGQTNRGHIFSTILPSYKARNELTFLPTRANVLVNANDVQDISASPHQELGMFFDSGNLSHLPADIATISSPSGKWGYPISHVSIFDVDDIDETSVGSLNWRDKFHQFVFSTERKFGEQERHGWIYKKEVEHVGAISGSNIYQDAWGLKPVKPTRIQFRPLTKELYSFLEYADSFRAGSFDFNYGAKNNWPNAFKRINSNGDFERFTRGSYSAELISYINGYYSPVSKFGVSRELSHLQPPPGNQLLTDAERNGSSSLIGPYGLKYSEDLGNDITKDLLDGTDIGYPYQWFSNEPWAGVGDGLQAAGGFGIIGATCTVYADTTLSFSTENVHLEDFRAVDGSNIHSLKTGDYDDDATTTLFAKVYQHWPRKQTLYDPRLFVVHHFNEGVEKPHTSSEAINLENITYDVATKQSGVILEDVDSDISQSQVDALLRQNNKLPDDSSLAAGYADPSGWFIKERKEMSVDLFRPTLWDGSRATIGTKVYGDAYTNSTLPEAEKIRRSRDWGLNITRRGKLLPYTYESLSIGIGDNVCVYMDNPEVSASFGTGEGEVPYNQIDVQGTDVLIVASGEGYKEDEEFTIQGGAGAGVIFKVTQVTAEGGITEIKARDPLDRGIGYDPFDFPDKLAFVPADPETDTPARWIPNTLIWTSGEGPPNTKLLFAPFSEGSKPPTGNGFTAYAVRGTVLVTPKFTDEKPKNPLDGGDEIELTARQYPLSQNTVNTFNIIEPDDDKTYDIFLRYHNDISHVGTFNGGDTPNPRDQMVTLTIDAQIGAAGVGESVDFNSAGGGAVAAAGGLGSANMGFSMGGSTNMGFFGGSLTFF